MSDLVERARAMIASAVAQNNASGGGAIAALHLTVYPTPETPLDAIRAAIDAARRGTPAEGARLQFKEAPTRYICWNCCGLRFEGKDGICPNCGSEALIVPEEILFALDRVEM
jgi:Zn finger protein HypA/HybF involved in hydrogenase expression